jgi:hypothetical protein
MMRKLNVAAGSSEPLSARKIKSDSIGMSYKTGYLALDFEQVNTAKNCISGLTQKYRYKNDKFTKLDIDLNDIKIIYFETVNYSNAFSLLFFHEPKPVANGPARFGSGVAPDRRRKSLIAALWRRPNRGA